MRQALMKAKGALGRWEFERLKSDYSRFQTLKECIFPFLNKARQSRIPPYFMNLINMASARNCLSRIC